MIKLKIIKEASSASEEARRMGLKYAGFGRWIDPDNRKLIAVTRNGQLVKVKHSDGAKGVAAPEKGGEVGAKGPEAGAPQGGKDAASKVANAAGAPQEKPEVPMPNTPTGSKRAEQFKRAIRNKHFSTAALINSLENNKFAKNLSPDVRKKLTIKSLNQMSDNIKQAVVNDVKKKLASAMKAVKAGSFFDDKEKQKVLKLLPYLRAANSALASGDFAEAFQQLARAPYSKTFYPNKALDIFYRYSFYDQINKFAIE